VAPLFTDPRMPRPMREAVERARRALDVMRHLQKHPPALPARMQDWPLDQQAARAFLSSAQATFEAWRRGQPWATAEKVTADFNAYSNFVAEILDRLGP
jgi:hypothetical protein